MKTKNSEFEPDFNWGGENWFVKITGDSVRINTGSLTFTLSGLKIRSLSFQGYPNKQIARKLGTTEVAVRSHLSAATVSNQNNEADNLQSNLSLTIEAHRRELLFPISLIGLRRIQSRLTGDEFRRQYTKEFGPLYGKYSPGKLTGELVRLITPDFTKKPLLPVEEH